MNSPEFHVGAAVLAAYGLPLDVWVYFSQLWEVSRLARAVPSLTIVVNHLGGPLGVGPYRDAAARKDADDRWRQGMRSLAALPNVCLKVGGLGMPNFGTQWSSQDAGPTSEQIAAHWRERVRWCIDLFGPRRCMFESNYPVDAQSFGYVEAWNALKLMTTDIATAERALLFRDTARSVYRI